MTFEQHLRSISRAASQRLGILKSWQVVHDKLLLESSFRGFVLPVLEYCSAVWCSAADTRLKLLDHVVSGASLLTCGMFECDIAHRRSVAVLCIHKIRCNLIHPHYGAQPGPYICHCVLHAVLWSHIGKLMRLLAAESRSTAELSFSCQYLCGTILVTSYSMVWDWQVSRAGPMTFYLASCSLPFSLLLFSHFFHSMG